MTPGPKIFALDAEPDVGLLRRTIMPSHAALTPTGRKEAVEDHLAMLAGEFAGQSALSYYHAGLIVHVRREGASSPRLGAFFRLWDQDADFLLDRLDLRWLISACDTFAEHGRNAAEQWMGMAATLLASAVKLYESERKATGAGSASYGEVGPSTHLLDGMTGYWIGRGDLVTNLLKRLKKLDDPGSPASRLALEIVRRCQAHDTVYRRLGRVHAVAASRWSHQLKKVAIFNDTSAGGHYGCVAVMDVLVDLFRRAGASVVYRHPLGADWRNSIDAARAIDEADVVVVNGEGTMHHSSLRARQLAALAPYCRDKGKRCFLVNATLQDNDRQILDDIRAFDYVWVRESVSSAGLLEEGVPHSICPDLTFLANFAPSGLSSSGVMLIDSVRPAVVQRLADYARSEQLNIVSMKRDPASDACLGARWEPLEQNADSVSLKQPLVSCPDYRAFAAMIADHRQIVTGRFHALCFSVVLRTPFHAFASNTHKVEATLADIGLDPARLLTTGDSFPDVLPFSPAELASIDAYIQRTQAAADRMIERILTL